MKISRILLPLTAVAALFPARADNATLIYSKDLLTVSAPLSVEAGSLGANYAVEVTPALVCGVDTVELEPLVFRQGLNRKATARGRRFGTLPAAMCPEYAAGGDAVAYTAAVSRAEHPGLWSGADVQLVLLREKSGCCATEQLPTLTLAEGRYVKPFQPVWAPVADNTGKAGELQADNPVLQHISKYRPYDTTRILRREEGALYVHFPLNSWELSRDFRDNAATLDRIVDITRQILADTTSSVKVIQIIGLASPEGAVGRNNLLAGNRAEALREYVAAAIPGIPMGVFECVNGGEAWTELRDQVAELSFPGSDCVLDIIDTEPDPDRRERRIKSLDGGRPYGYLRENVLSDQRNSGYVRIYFDYVPDTAAAAINTASALLAEGEWRKAADMLQPLEGDPRAWNALATALYMLGDDASRQRALDLFRRAADAGNQQATQNLKQLIDN